MMDQRPGYVGGAMFGDDGEVIEAAQFVFHRNTSGIHQDTAFMTQGEEFLGEEEMASILERRNALFGLEDEIDEGLHRRGQVQVREEVEVKNETEDVSFQPDFRCPSNQSRDPNDSEYIDPPNAFGETFPQEDETFNQEDEILPRYDTEVRSKGFGVEWGREKDIGILNAIISTLVFLFSPLVVFYFWHSLEHYDGSLLAPITALMETDLSLDSLITWGEKLFPTPTMEGFLLYGGWLLFHALAYLWFPSKIGHGQETPAGYILPYRVNGFSIWILTHVLFVLLSVGYGLFDPAIIQKNWGGLLVATNVYGYCLTFFSYLKAHLFPTFAEDRKFSGYFIYDLFMGIELNPRLGDLDFKLFHNGRPGITGWTLINLSFMFAQYQSIGHVTASMAILNILHMIYVVDFFYNEDWYLRTIDIAHDHFGFYLAWGDSVWLPFMYTLQAQYLYLYPVELSYGFSAFILALGLAGYYIFRTVNHQKDLVRKKRGDVEIWGKRARVIRAQYMTGDGECHSSLLLVSGYWGISRHFNYVGDLMMCLAFCLTCGFEHALPHFYFVYMVILLLHRVQRDHSRCLGKYGAYWEKYCELVPYKVIPYVY